MQTRERAHCARSVFPFIKKKKIESASYSEGKYSVGTNEVLL